MVQKPTKAGDSMESPSRRASWPMIALAVLAITFVEARELRLMHGRFEQAFVENCRAITQGHAQWVVYQNRIAGPYGVLFLSRVTGMPFEDAYRLVLQGLLYLSNCCAFAAGRRFTGTSRGAWAIVLANALLFVAVQHDYIYIWDYIDATTMLLFAYGVINGSGSSLFVALFFIELLNREAASFIALWIVLDAVTELLRRPATGRRGGWLRMAFGMVLGAGGAWWTHWVRARLLRYKPPDFSDLALGQQYQWPYNLMTLRHPLDADTLIALLMLGGLGFGYFRAAPALGDRKIAVSLLLAAMIGSTFAFARMDETRVWIAFIPFLIFLCSAAAKDGGWFNDSRDRLASGGPGGRCPAA